MLKIRGKRMTIAFRGLSVDEARFLARKLRNAVGETADDNAPMVLRRIIRSLSSLPSARTAANLASSPIFASIPED